MTQVNWRLASGRSAYGMNSAWFALFPALALIFLLGSLPGPTLAADAAIAVTGDKVQLSSSAPVIKLKQAVEREMLAGGFLLQSAQEGALIFEGEPDSATKFMWTNANTGEKPKFRYRVNLVDLTDSRRVVISKSVWVPSTKTRPAHEQPRERSGDIEELQTLLRKVAATTDK